VPSVAAHAGSLLRAYRWIVLAAAVAVWATALWVLFGGGR
jgi:hypothetical protein